METTGPLEPSLRLFMGVLLGMAAGHPAPLQEPDMGPFCCADKLDSDERIVHYIEQ
jgi:hypothetical protein